MHLQEPRVRKVDLASVGGGEKIYEIQQSDYRTDFQVEYLRKQPGGNTWLRESGFMIFIWYLEITQYVTITPLLPFRSIALMEQTWFHFAIFPNQNQNSEGLYDSRQNKLARLEHAKSHRNYIGVGSLKSDVGSYLASDQSNKKWWCHRCSPILTIPIVHIMCWMALQLNSRPLWCHFNCTISQEASIPHRRAEFKEYQLIIEDKLNIF